MSVIFYKFKSCKDFDTITFDGTGCSVFDLKRDIMINKKLGKGLDFDLSIFNAQTQEEYEDDTTIIQRNTSVLVARLPVGKTSKGCAQRYLNAPIQMPRTTNRPTYIKPITAVTSNSESQNDDGISLMFKQQAEQWQNTQDQMATVKPVYRPTARPANGAAAQYRPEIYSMEQQRPPPPGYTCFRCGEKGHYINQCPTIGDAGFDNKPKIKRATGIPTMFLKTIQNKEGVDRGLMVTGEGDLVVAMPNDDVKMQNMNQKFGNVGDAYDTAPVVKGLDCFICRKLLRDAVKAPCCSTNYCDNCIVGELLENDDVNKRLKCPKCHAKLIPDNLSINRDVRDRVVAHIRKHARSKGQKDDAIQRELPSKGKDKRLGDQRGGDQKRYRPDDQRL